MVTYRIFDEIVDFLASGPAPADILAFQPSADMIANAGILLEKKRNNQLSESELQELDKLMMVEHIMRMAKAKARHHLTK
jgi:hypothetical protein